LQQPLSVEKTAQLVNSIVREVTRSDGVGHCAVYAQVLSVVSAALDVETCFHPIVGSLEVFACKPDIWFGMRSDKGFAEFIPSVGMVGEYHIWCGRDTDETVADFSLINIEKLARTAHLIEGGEFFRWSPPEPTPEYIYGVTGSTIPKCLRYEVNRELTYQVAPALLSDKVAIKRILDAMKRRGIKHGKHRLP